MRRFGLVIAFVAAVGCSSMKGRADDLYSAGRFLEAAELYDQVVRANPNDAEAMSRREAARNGALRVQLAYVAKLRTTNHLELAAAQLEKLLALRDGWRVTVEVAIRSSLANETTAIGAWLDGLVANRVRTAGPLVGEKIAVAYARFLAFEDLANRRQSIAEHIHAAGRDACARLVPTATTPYWTWITHRYCAHFGARTPVVRALPHAIEGLAVAGELDGVSSGESQHVRDALAIAFRESVWFAPGGNAPVTAALSGAVATSFDAQNVTRYADYTVEIPYTVYEDREESYQEPYTDTEYYTEQVPRTEYTSESYACGSSTCTRSVPTTVYHSESKTRTVTKYRTAYRTVTEPVTKYRTEPRTYTYAAVERSGRYSSKLSLALGAELAGLVVSVGDDFAQSGIDHDAYFSEAGVSPSRANLLTAEDFVVREQQRLAAALREKLDAHYAERFCSAASYSLEDAAACAYLDPDAAPSLARGMLRAQFGEDAALLATVLARN